MSNATRLFEGPFGRLLVGREVIGETPEASPDARIVLQFDDSPSALRLREYPLSFTRNQLLLLNPGQEAWHTPGSAARSRVVVFEASAGWLGKRFPALFCAPQRKPFQRPVETITPRIRRLADALAIEALNGRFLAPERLEFMLQELTLSLVEAYLAKRGTGSPPWKGSPFADSRIRRALALLRVQPNKELDMNRVATAVGLSRSRFYDLFQLCTGLAPRAYLDMLCIEAAITRLASRGARIGEVSAALGFSAHSNFTRFFLTRVGVPPSAYRRASAGENAPATTASRP